MNTPRSDRLTKRQQRRIEVMTRRLRGEGNTIMIGSGWALLTISYDGRATYFGLVDRAGGIVRSGREMPEGEWMLRSHVTGQFFHCRTENQAMDWVTMSKE